MILAATGHRPNKLGGYAPAVDAALCRLATALLLKHRPDKAISGMALGWDMAWAEAALATGVPLIAAVPFQGQESQWPPASRERFARILAQAERVEIVCPGGYSPAKMHSRNEWMVDNCDILVALWDGSPGGTASCVRYAQMHQRPIKNLWPVWQAVRA